MPRVLGIELEVGFVDQLAKGRPVFADLDAVLRQYGLVFCRFFDSGTLHYELDDVRFESRGLAIAANALYLRLPHELVAGVAAGIFAEDALWKMALLYMVYGELEFAYVLMKLTHSLNLSEDGKKGCDALRRALERFAGVRWPIS